MEAPNANPWNSTPPTSKRELATRESARTSPSRKGCGESGSRALAVRLAELTAFVPRFAHLPETGTPDVLVTLAPRLARGSTARFEGLTLFVPRFARTFPVRQRVRRSVPALARGSFSRAPPARMSAEQRSALSPLASRFSLPLEPRTARNATSLTPLAAQVPASGARGWLVSLAIRRLARAPEGHSKARARRSRCRELLDGDGTHVEVSVGEDAVEDAPSGK